MNMGIVTSFVIGGLLLISMLTLNSRVVTDSSRTTVDLVNKTHLDGIRQLVDYDFSHIGFGDNDEIKSFNSDAIKFVADYEGDNDVEITWEFDDNNAFSGSSNPNDYTLKRTVGTSGPSQEFRVIDFSMEAFDSDGNTIATCISSSTCEDIRNFKIRIVYESAEPAGKNADGTDIYPRSVWSKRIIPGNLNFN